MRPLSLIVSLPLWLLSFKDYMIIRIPSFKWAHFQTIAVDYSPIRVNSGGHDIVMAVGRPSAWKKNKQKTVRKQIG